jgi:hypothetical protein
VAPATKATTLLRLVVHEVAVRRRIALAEPYDLLLLDVYTPKLASARPRRRSGSPAAATPELADIAKE